MKELDIYEFSMMKSKVNERTTRKDIKKMEEESLEIMEKIKKTKMEIEILKQVLKKEEELKRNRVEYDLLSCSIIQFPNRKVQEDNLKELKKVLEKLKTENGKLFKRIEFSKKKFNLIVQQLHEQEEEEEQEDQMQED
jgi:hypothetical protein